MKSRGNPSQQPKAVLAALLLLAVTASGCGVGLPTRPDLDQATGGERLATSLGAEESGTPVELGEPTSGGLVVGDPQNTVPAPTGETVVPSPGAGARAWGRGHNKSRKPKH